MMDEITKEMYLMYADTREYQRTEEHLFQIVDQAFLRFKRPYIAYSGGKDSLVMTHAVLQQHPDTIIFHWDYGPYFMPRNLEQEILGIAQKIGVKNIRIETSPKYETNGRKKEKIFIPCLFGKILPQMKAEGFDLSVVGLRSGESKKRKIKINGKPFRLNAQMDECYPVYHFSTRDIWTYITSNNLPYCSHYDKYGAIKGIENVRLCTFFDPEFQEYNYNFDGLLMPEFRNV